MEEADGWLRTRTNAGQGPLQTHVYDVAPGLPVLLDDGNRQYVYGAGGLAFAVAGNGRLEVYHTDGLGPVGIRFGVRRVRGSPGSELAGLTAPR